MSNRQIIALVLSLNGAYLAVLFSLMAYRLLSGLSPMPEGCAPLVMGSAIVIPIASGGLGNLLRLRRDASRTIRPEAQG
jgi:hypothetical protein